ncbi:MAG: hypothetical protein AB7P03_02205 [Kofleriaceae bacterium]
MNARVALGVLIVALHAAGFAAVTARLTATDLSVELDSPLAAPAIALEGKTPAALADRVTTELDDDATLPGLAHRRWVVRYRGGFERAVGAAQLVGPFQDPEAHACVGRVVVSQRLLDDGTAGPSTVAGQIAKQIDAELRGLSVFPIGDYLRIDKLSVQWATVAARPDDRSFVGDAPHGYVRAAFTVVFERAATPLVVALIPNATPDGVQFRIASRAQLAFDNRAVQWLSKNLGGDRLATRLASRELDGVLIDALAPPPPFELPGGHTLRFRYCGGPPSIVDQRWGALPFAIELGRVHGQPLLLPPRRGPAAPLEIAADAALAIDLDLDALNAILFELWRTGFLDRELADAGLDRRFNTDPLVQEFLSVRMSPIRLALPPVLAPDPRGVRMSADARIAISDGVTTTIGRVWGGLAFDFAGQTVDPVKVDLGALELSCERSATTLVPCYADLVAALHSRGHEFQGALTTAFAALLADIFVDRRLSTAGAPADLVIRSAKPRVRSTANNASLHFDLDASVVAPE